MVATLLWALMAVSPRAATTDRLRLLDPFVEEAMVAYRVPGLALAVVEGDQVVFLKGYGRADPTGRPVTPQTPFFLGSVSKSFTAMAVMRLVEAGRLELDAPVKRYLPWFSMKDGGAGPAAADRITLRQVLHHTSGIAQPTGQTALAVTYDKPDALERQVRSFVGVALARPPGSSFEYANANYQIAGLVVQIVGGRGLEDLFEEHIFKPLAMAHSHTSPIAAQADGLATGYRWWFDYPVAFPGQPFPRSCLPSGFCISTAEDLGHYLIAHMNHGRYRESAVLSPESLAILHQPGLNDYAMGWYVAPDRTIEHGGQLACFGAHLYVDTKNQRGIALLVNVNRGVGCGHLYQLAPAMAKLLAGGPGTRPPIDHGDRASLWQLLGAFVGVGVWLSWSGWRLRGWAKGTSPAPRGWRLWLFLILSPLVECLVVAGLVVAVPVAISVAFLHSPDAMWLWFLTIGMTAGWGLLRTLWTLHLLSRGDGLGPRRAIP